MLDADVTFVTFFWPGDFFRAMVMAAAWGSPLTRPGVDVSLTWEPDPKSGSESRASPVGAAQAGSVTLKSEDEWPQAFSRFSLLYLRLYFLLFRYALWPFASAWSIFQDRARSISNRFHSWAASRCTRRW